MHDLSLVGVGGGRAIRDRGASLVSEGLLSWASWRRRQRGKDLVPGGKVPRGRVKRVRSGNNFLTYLRLHLLGATNCETSRNSSLPIVLWRRMEGNGGGVGVGSGGVFSRGTGFLVSRSTDRDLGKLGELGSVLPRPILGRFSSDRDRDRSSIIPPFSALSPLLPPPSLS